MRDYLEILVDGDGAIRGEGDAKDFEVQALCAGLSTCGHEDDIGLHTLRLTFLCLEEYLTISNLPDTTLHVKRDTLLLHQFAQTFGDIAVEGRETLLQELDDRHL